MKRYTGFILIAAIVFSIGLVFSRARAEISSATSDGGTTILTIPAHRYDSTIGLYQSDASLARGIQFATSIYAVDTMSGTTSIQGIYK